MNKCWMIGLAVIALGIQAGCSNKQATYNPSVVKSDIPSLEQETVAPGQQRASTEFLETGKRKWRVGDTKKAMKNFRKSVEKNPYNFEAHYWIAIIERDQRRWDKAGLHFQQAVKYCPQGRWEARVRVDWGYLFELQGQKGLAAKQYDLALLADPNFREAQSARERVLPLPSAGLNR